MNCFLSVTSEGPGGRRGTELPDCLFTFALFKWSLSSQHLLHITTQISVLMTAIMPVLTHTCSNTSAHTYTACSITIIHRSSGTLYPLQTTLHNKWTFSHCRPFCLLRAFHFSSQFGVVWWMQMGTYLIGSVPKMEINGALPSPCPPPPSYFEPLSVQRCVEGTLMRRGEESPPLLDSFKTLCSRLALTPTQWGKEAAWAPCATVSQCQFSNVPAGDATCKLSNQEASHGQLWFWYMQVVVEFFHSTDKLDGSQIQT